MAPKNDFDGGFLCVCRDGMLRYCFEVNERVKYIEYDNHLPSLYTQEEFDAMSFRIPSRCDPPKQSSLAINRSRKLARFTEFCGGYDEEGPKRM